MKAILLLLFATALVSAESLVPVDPVTHFEGLSTPIRDEPRTLQMVLSGELLGEIPPGSTMIG